MEGGEGDYIICDFNIEKMGISINTLETRAKTLPLGVRGDVEINGALIRKLMS